MIQVEIKEVYLKLYVAIKNEILFNSNTFDKAWVKKTAVKYCPNKALKSKFEEFGLDILNECIDNQMIICEKHNQYVSKMAQKRDYCCAK